MKKLFGSPLNLVEQSGSWRRELSCALAFVRKAGEEENQLGYGLEAELTTISGSTSVAGSLEETTLPFELFRAPSRRGAHPPVPRPCRAFRHRTFDERIYSLRNGTTGALLAVKKNRLIIVYAVCLHRFAIRISNFFAHLSHGTPCKTRVAAQKGPVDLVV